MFELNLLELKNTIALTLKGKIESLDAAQIAHKLKASLEVANPGVCLICDISELKQGKEEYVLLMREVMEMLSKKNPSKVIRVVGKKESDVQFDTAWNNEFVTYPVIKVKSMEEAMVEIEKEQQNN